MRESFKGHIKELNEEVVAMGGVGAKHLGLSITIVSITNVLQKSKPPVKIPAR